MRNYFTLDGVDSRDFGVYISGQGVFNAPPRAVEFLSVPGRDGDLIGMETRLENADLVYKDAFIYRAFQANIAALRAFLLESAGYRRLIDSYHPEEYRMAAYIGPLDVKPSGRLNAGKFDLTFRVMPQRYLLSGEEAQTFTASGSIVNPTRFVSRPLIRVYGSGVLGVGDMSVTVINNTGNYIDIDSASGIASRGAVNMNSSITTSGFDLPTLGAGEIGIALGAGIDRVEITPRWWTV